MNDWITTDEVRLGRNYLRVGDVVRVLPSRKSKHDGFKATVRAIIVNEDGDVRWVDVHDRRNGALRSVRLERVQRKAQTHNGERGD